MKGYCEKCKKETQMNEYHNERKFIWFTICQECRKFRRIDVVLANTIVYRLIKKINWDHVFERINNE